VFLHESIAANSLEGKFPFRLGQNKGTGLPLGSALFLVESALQLGESLLEFVDLVIARVASRAWRTVHGDRLVSRQPSIDG
jgi:hypothetical protein